MKKYHSIALTSDTRDKLKKVQEEIKKEQGMSLSIPNVIEHLLWIRSKYNG